MWGRRDLRGGGKAKGPSQPRLEDQVPGGEPEETEKPPPPSPAPPLQGVAVKNAGVRMPGPAAVSCATWGMPLHLSVPGSSSTKWNS